MSDQPRIVGRRRRHTRPLIAIMLAALLLSAAPLQALAEPSFTFRARGNGHGVGMSQYGAAGFASQGFSYSHILRHYYQGTSIGTISPGQTMRVALQATDTPATSWTFTTPHAPMRVDWSGRGTGSYLTLNRGVVYRFSTGGSTSVVTVTNVSTGAVVGTLNNATWVNLFEFDTTKPNSTGLTRVHDASGPFSRANILYQGWISLVRGSGGDASRLHLRNLVQIEDYVKCVLPREMPASWHAEALKAQAVAARSYAITSKRPSSSFDVWCTVNSQVYNGWGDWFDGRARRHNETSPGVGGDWRSDPAVDATRGQVATYNGTPITTYFFSTSGGHTENSENVWSATLPYARGVVDPYEYLAGSPSHNLPQVTLSASQVRSRLVSEGFTAAELPGTISGIRVTERGVSGRVLRMQLLGAAGDHKTLDRTATRRFRVAVSRSQSYPNGWNTNWFYVNPKTERVAGSDRYATSVESSKLAFVSAGQVVLVGGRAPADALSAAAFAASLPGGAPILLTEPGRLTPVTRAEIERLGASKVYVIGGDLAVGPSVEGALASIPALQGPGRVERIGGANRYETARMLAERVLTTVPGNRVFVVNGDNLADALAVSPVAYARRVPIVPVRAGSIPPESASVLARPEVTRSLVVGGRSAVGDAVYARLPSPTRIADGANRYDTAAKVAAWSIANEDFRVATTYVASGISPIDALTAAPLIGGWRHSVLFATRDSLPEPTRATLAARKGGVSIVRMLGGEGVLGNGVEASIERTLE